MCPTRILTTTTSMYLYDRPSTSGASLEGLGADNVLSVLADSGDFYRAHNTYANLRY